MSRLSELMAELCPDGVEYKRLGDVVNVSRGVRVVKRNLLPDGKYPVYQNSLKPLGYHDKFNCTANTAFVISAGSAGEIGYSTSEFWAADDCLYISCGESLNSRFVYYFLMSKHNEIKRQVRRAAVPRLPRTAIDNLLVPIPPLKVQAEIVRILDKWSDTHNGLIALLTRELELRKEQYSYYLDKLLTFTPKEKK